MTDPTRTQPTDKQIAHVARTLAGFESVTTFLRALASVVALEHGDDEGAHLLASCISLWRAHERGSAAHMRLDSAPSWLPPKRNE